ncbi:hypothetical protein TgHK011_002320 [Trichoderma gracile]|nr:hypothetical protein TgHK011_002320 [Trichoderma gracile]
MPLLSSSRLRWRWRCKDIVGMPYFSSRSPGAYKLCSNASSGRTAIYDKGSCQSALKYFCDVTGWGLSADAMYIISWLSPGQRHHRAAKYRHVLSTRLRVTGHNVGGVRLRMLIPRITQRGSN